MKVLLSVLAAKLLVSLDDAEAFFEDRARPFAPVIEVSSHHQRFVAVHHAVDAVADAADLAPALSLQ